MEGPEAQEWVPRLARPFVAALIGLMVASAVFVWEPWPIIVFVNWAIVAELIRQRTRRPAVSQGAAP